MIRALARLNAWLLGSAARRMGAERAEWAQAMSAEYDLCRSGLDRLGWGLGCWVASLRISGGFGSLVYPSALVAGLAIVAGYEWSADESGATVAILVLVALGLGMLRPRRAAVSGALVGLVVAGVIGFEALSTIQPAYETRAQTIAHGLCWLILLAPSLASASAGAWIGRQLRPGRPSP